MSAFRPVSEDDLHAYVDGVLDAERRAEVEAYLAANASVAKRVRNMEAGRAALRGHFAPVLAEPIPSELILARIVAERRPRIEPRWRAAAAAIILLALGGAGGWFGRGAATPEATGIAALAREAAINWAVYAPDRLRPVEVRASDGEILAEWMRARLGRVISPPNLAASGYRLMGGRVVATAHGPAGLLMYDDDRGSRIVLLTRRMQAVDETPAMSPGRNGATTTWSWVRASIGFSLAGEGESGSLHGIADEIRRQAGKGV